MEVEIVEFRHKKISPVLIGEADSCLLTYLESVIKGSCHEG